MKRTAFVRHALECIGTPYIWGGRSSISGLDCWGLVAHAADLAGGPSSWSGWWTDRGWGELKPIATAAEMHPGDLCFYGGDPTNPADVSHVAIWLNNLGMLIESNGGGRTTSTFLEARRIDAKVRITDDYLRRRDFRGFRRLPAD